MSEELVIMPKSLTAENGAKHLLIGEFSETVIMQCEYCDDGLTYSEGVGTACEDCDGAGDYALKVTIEWSTIKDIYAKCVDKLEQK